MQVNKQLHVNGTFINHRAFILFIGSCTEYSESANLIQQSFKANCDLFSQKPCPYSYNSTEAYKCK